MQINKMSLNYVTTYKTPLYIEYFLYLWEKFENTLIMKNKLLILAMGFALTTQMIIAQVPSYVPTNGLVGYWPFNGNANDESGNGNNGTVNGAILTSDRNDDTNSAFSFDGLSSSISISSLNNLQYKPITYSVWINPNELNTISYPLGGGLVILGRDWSGNYNQGALVIFDYPAAGINNHVGYYTGQSSGQTNYTPLLNQWTLIVMTLDDNDTLNFYVNGTLVSSQYYPTNSTLDGPFKIGAGTDVDINSNRGLFKGKIDDIGIWNRALTTGEINNLYNSQSTSTNECLTMTINTEPLSTNPVTYKSSVTIYPNPANDQITIDCGNLANVSGWSIKITNMLGQEVFNQPMDTQQYLVPLNSWTGQGMYFVKIINAQNQVVNIKKIILQ